MNAVDRHAVEATNMMAMAAPMPMGENSLANNRVTTSVVSSADVVRQRDGAVDVAGAAHDRAQVFVDDLELALVGGQLAFIFECARTIDDARQALRQHAEGDAHAGDQEHRAQRQLDEVRDVFGLQVDAGHGAEVCHTHAAC